MNKAVFVTGTDTGVGKTLITGLFLRFLHERGIKVITQKWVQTGSVLPPEDLITHMEFIENGREILQKNLEEMAPYVFEFPSSPHFAAGLKRERISTDRIIEKFRKLEKKFDFVIAEGSGGLLVPLNDTEFIVDIAKKLRLPVIIAVENRLGTINQTLLAIEALKRRNLEIIGMVFNRLSDKHNGDILDDNKRTIESLSGEKVLGELRYSEDKETLYKDFLPIGGKILKILKISYPQK